MRQSTLDKRADALVTALLRKSAAAGVRDGTGGGQGPKDGTGPGCNNGVPGPAPKRGQPNNMVSASEKDQIIGDVIAALSQALGKPEPIRKENSLNLRIATDMNRDVRKIAAIKTALSGKAKLLMGLLGTAGAGAGIAGGLGGELNAQGLATWAQDLKNRYDGTGGSPAEYQVPKYLARPSAAQTIADKAEAARVARLEEGIIRLELEGEELRRASEAKKRAEEKALKGTK